MDLVGCLQLAPSAGDGHTRTAQGFQGLVSGRWVHVRGERCEHPGRETGFDGVESGGPHAIAGGDSDHVHAVDVVVSQYA